MKSKEITKERFLCLKENIRILNTMTHQIEDTIITDNTPLTVEIYKLKEAIARFEARTGLKVEVN